MHRTAPRTTTAWSSRSDLLTNVGDQNAMRRMSVDHVGASPRPHSEESTRSDQPSRPDTNQVADKVPDDRPPSQNADAPQNGVIQWSNGKVYSEPLVYDITGLWGLPRSLRL